MTWLCKPIFFLPCALENLAEAVGTKAFTQALGVVGAFHTSVEMFVGSTSRKCEKSIFLRENAVLYLQLCLFLKLHKKAVELCFAPIHSQFALSFPEKQNLFMVYINALQVCGRYEEACRIIKLNLAKMRKFKLQTVLHISYLVLGMCLHGMGSAKTALKFYKKGNCLLFFGLVFHTSPIPHDHWIDCYQSLGKFTKALKHANKALAEYDKEKDKLSTCGFYYAMFSKGHCLFKLGRIEEAKDVFETIKRMRRKSLMFGDNDHFTIRCDYMFSLCLKRLGDPEHALNLYENARDKDNFRNEGFKDPTGAYLKHKAECLLQSKKTSEAYHCYKELLSHYQVGRKTENDLDIFQCLASLGDCAGRLGKHHEAVEYFRKMLIVLENHKPFLHVEIAKIKRAIALLLSNLNRYDEAIPYYADKSVSKVDLGDKWRYDGDIALGQCYMFCDNVTEAIRLYRNAFEILEKLPKSGIKRLCNARDYVSDVVRTNMLTCLYKLQLYDSEALHHGREAWRESVELECETRFANRKVKALSKYGYCLLRLERYPECVQALKHALYIAQEAYEQPHSDEEFFIAATTLIRALIVQGKKCETHFYYYSPSVYYRCTCCNIFTEIPETNCP